MADANTEMLRIAAENLGELVDELVFLGGCVTGLLITDAGAPEPRPTTDVDTIVEAATYSQYVRFSKRLKKAGFREDSSEDAPICRWVKNSTLLDVMPLDEKVLGFASRWYPRALETAEKHRLDNTLEINLVSPVYFCATKIEAFNDRGIGDFLASHDLEDIISVVDGREELVREIVNADRDAQQFISGTVRNWLKESAFNDALPGHLGEADTGRIGVVRQRLNEIADLYE